MISTMERVQNAVFITTVIVGCAVLVLSFLT
jgi:hypothetical protein